MASKDVALETKKIFDVLNSEIASLEADGYANISGFCREANERLISVGSSLRFSPLCVIDADSQETMTLGQAFAHVFLQHYQVTEPIDDNYDKKGKL